MERLHKCVKCLQLNTTIYRSQEVCSKGVHPSLGYESISVLPFAEMLKWIRYIYQAHFFLFVIEIH